MKFLIRTTTTNCTVYNEYEVEANSKDEALAVVEAGNADCTHEEINYEKENRPDEWDAQVIEE